MRLFLLERVFPFPGREMIIWGSRGWRSGESARLPPVWSGFKSWRRRHVWVEFVVGSLPCSERFFSVYSGFPLSSKTNISKFLFDQESGRRRTTLWMCYLQIIIYLLIYLLNFKNLITGSRHYHILVKTRRRMTTDDVGSRARTTKTITSQKEKKRSYKR